MSARHLVRYFVYALAGSAMALIVAAPFLEYAGAAEPVTIAVRVAAVCLMVLGLAVGLAARLMLFTPKYRAQRPSTKQLVVRTRMPRAVFLASVFGLMLGAGAITTILTSFVHDPKLSTLIAEVVPVIGLGGFAVWMFLRARKAQAQEDANSPDNIFS
jgi:hypothetical protein